MNPKIKKKHKLSVIEIETNQEKKASIKDTNKLAYFHNVQDSLSQSSVYCHHEWYNYAKIDQIYEMRKSIQFLTYWGLSGWVAFYTLLSRERLKISWS